MFKEDVSKVENKKFETNPIETKEETINNKKSPNKTIYICNNCNYKTKRKYDYSNHLNTKKHKIML